MTIYVLRSDNLVKIGFSEDIRTRVRSIVASVPVPVEFVGHMPGNREVEKYLHRRFAESHFSGEWFVETEVMTAVFNALLTPRMPKIPTERQSKRRADVDEIRNLSDRLRKEASDRWPDADKGQRLTNVAQALGWNRSRVRDLYYADRRIALRDFERGEVEAFLASRAVVGARIDG